MSASHDMKVTVVLFGIDTNSNTNNQAVVSCNASDTIRSIKEKVLESNDIPAMKEWIDKHPNKNVYDTWALHNFKGTTVYDNDKTLEEYKIKDGAVLYTQTETKCSIM
eukprot:TRINITY_DN6017_c0_g1_i2.p2 TRINITY_DN6017_c0_g1~~TRINITY_DN6017_c0_g1_i2.p2  ORF type:complete len:108 (+),score=20.69 TRINITY_DN6017_c0_g1_i2:59-382(+)